MADELRYRSREEELRLAEPTLKRLLNGLENIVRRIAPTSIDRRLLYGGGEALNVMRRLETIANVIIPISPAVVFGSGMLLTP